MDPEVRAVKRKFNHALEPIKVMLVNRKPLVPGDEWLRFVQHTRARVISHPEEYLGAGLPEPAMIEQVVQMIFDEFLFYAHAAPAEAGHRKRSSS